MLLRQIWSDLDPDSGFSGDPDQDKYMQNEIDAYVS